MQVQLVDQRETTFPLVDIQRLQRYCQQLLDLLGLSEKTLALILLSDAQMAQYNQQFRAKTGTTNVLSFPAGFPEEAFAATHNDLGDVLIAVETAAHEAREQECSLMERLVQLSLHGLLHLIGYDHERSEEEALAMWDKEQSLLAQLFYTRRHTMPHLAVNVDHVATLRQARGAAEPDPVLAAALCELAGARGVVVHLREDRRHIQDRDVRLLRQTVKTRLNLEMAVTKEMLALAMEIKPDLVTLVPEKRQELTTEGGLDVVAQQKKIAAAVNKLRKAGMLVSLFIDAEAEQIQAAAEIGASHVELHTGHYCSAAGTAEEEREFVILRNAAELAAASNLLVNAGHGLDYRNTERIAALPEIAELSIGHAIVSRAVLVGMEQAVREMLTIIQQAK